MLVRIPGGTVSNPAQLAFFDEDGNPLYFEIDTWDASNESLAWVGLRTFRAGATITLAAGKSGYESPNLAYGLWRRADYILVLHIRTAAQRNDSKKQENAIIYILDFHIFYA